MVKDVNNRFIHIKRINIIQKWNISIVYLARINNVKEYLNIKFRFPLKIV